MTYATAAAFRTALEQRLLTYSRETEIPLNRLRKLVVFDRLMARLRVIAPEAWILKGAVALLYRAGPHYRTTKDIDFARRDDEQRATADFIAVQNLNLGDYFSFAIERTDLPDTVAEAGAVRYYARSELAGRTFEDITIDVAFSEKFEESPEIIRSPDLLGFAEISPIEVPALPLVLHVAEKVHAYTRVYQGGRQSSRVKDLIDLAMIESLFDFKARQLRDALELTFSSRATHPVPSKLPPPPADWRVPYRQLAAEVGLSPDLLVGYEQSRRFLDPLLSGACPDGANWHPAEHLWV